MKYKNLFVGGTFDELHKGHESVLHRAFEEGERVTIGLTSNEFVKNFKLQTSNFKIENSLNISNSTLKIRGYKTRKRAIKRWVIANKFNKRTRVIPIDDPYEPASSGDFDALIVTKDNQTTGEEINRKRREKGLMELALIEVPLIHAQDSSPISSTRLRNGEIDENGRLIMPQSLIPALRKPLGKIVGEKETRELIKDLRGKTIITVGDQTTKTLLDFGVIPQLAIIDGKVGRKPFHDVIDLLQPARVSPFQAKRVKSGPGYISKEALQAIRSKHKEKRVIIVDGEEDLLALPAILCAPIGSIVLYGQPGEGIVLVRITKRIQNKAHTLLKKFLVSK